MSNASNHVSPWQGIAGNLSTAQQFARTNWNLTELGPPEQWPQSLCIALSLCLNSRFPMFVWWGPKLINIYNDAYAPMLGKRHPQAMGRPARDSWEDIWPVLQPQVNAVMQEGQATWNEQVLLVTERNGYAENAWFTWSYSPIYQEDGSVGGLFCAVSEETGRVAAEADRDRLVRAAQDTARTLHNWFDNAPGFIALLRGPNFVIEMVNKAYHQLVGHRDAEGLPLFEALPDARGQGFEELLAKVLETGVPFVGRGLRLAIQREPGGPLTQAFIDLLYQPVRDADGQVIGVFAQGHEVTEQVRAIEALKVADRRKDEFLATLAHELRNPLAPIRQAAMVARLPGVDSTKQAWALDIIERQVGHMGLLLDDLLDISRISRGRLALRLQQVDLHQVVGTAVETARPLLDGKSHRLDVKLPALPTGFAADPMRLSQVLSNLLTNAAKYTPEGGRIELAASVVGQTLVVKVRDNGIGLAAESQDSIFEMFSQVESPSGQVESGLGIGLALSRALVQLHGGALHVHSEGIGQGSEFAITLPLAPALRTA
jgi:signal transduction histidine kinase